MDTTGKRCISKSDWNDLKGFAASDSRPDLMLELVANAEQLAADGYHRSAIIEGVSALEIAVSSFGRLPRLIDELIHP